MAWEPDYLEVDELAEFVRISDDIDNAQIALAIGAASRAIDEATHRQFGKVDAPVSRYYTPRFIHARGRWAVDIADLMDDTGLTVRFDHEEDGTYTSEVTAYRLTPANAVADHRPWTRLEVLPRETTPISAVPDGIEIIGLPGWDATPTTIKQATALQASRLLGRRDAPFGVAGSPENGSEIRLLERLDPDVEVTVRPYIRWRKRPG